MKRKKGTDTNQYAAIITMGYEAEILIEEGKRTEENLCLAKPQVRSCSLNILETKEMLMMW